MAAAVCEALRILAGELERREGLMALMRHAETALAPEHILTEAYRLTEPLSLHRAAGLYGVEIDRDRFTLPNVRPLVVEGAGGALEPVTREMTFAAVFAEWRLMTIIVVRTGLGTINHTLMTIEALRARRVPIQSVAFVGDANEDNEANIAEMGQLRCLGRLPRLPELTAPALAAAFAEGFRFEDFS